MWGAMSEYPKTVREVVDWLNTKDPYLRVHHFSECCACLDGGYLFVGEDRLNEENQLDLTFWGNLEKLKER